MKFQTTMQLMSAAMHIEDAARARYQRLGSEMARLGKTEVADTFQTLADGKRRRLLELGAAANGVDETTPAAMHARQPQIDAFADDYEDIDERYAMTPQQALNLAIRAEDRNLALYADIAAYADDAAVVELAEGMASYGLDQVRRLRLSRRQVDRTRTATVYRQRVEAMARQTASAVGAETALRGIIAALASRLKMVADAGNKSGPDRSQAIAQAAALVGDIITGPVAHMETPDLSEDAPFKEPPQTRAIADVEIAFDGIMSVAENCGDENCMRQALEFATALIPIFHLLRRA
jgi:hypothetical protein